MRAWLDQALIRGGFSGYEQLAAELQARGFEISKSSLHRYGSEFEKQLGAIRLATEQARAIAEAAGDEEGVLNDALIRLIQQKAFEALTRLSMEEADVDFTDLGNMLSRLSKASIDQKRWAAEVRRRDAAQVAELEKAAREGKNSLDPETLRRIREEVYGLS